MCSSLLVQLISLLLFISYSLSKKATEFKKDMSRYPSWVKYGNTFTPRNGDFDFVGGKPGDEFLPKEFMSIAIADAFKKQEDNYLYRMMNYGEYPGDYKFREIAANWLSGKYGSTVNKDNIFVSNGNSQGLNIILNTLFKEGDSFFIEAPTYFLAIPAIKAMKLNVTSILRDEDKGFDLVELEKLIIQRRPKGMYIIPSFHNPSSHQLPLEQRNGLYNLAVKYGVYIITDDVYEMLVLDESQRFPPVFSCSNETVAAFKTGNQTIIPYDNNSTKYIISLFSFSKIVSPGWRFGFIQAHSDIISLLSTNPMVVSGGGLNAASNMFFRSYIELGLADKWISYLKVAYSERIERISEAFDGSKAFSVSKPAGGYFFWIRISDKVNLDQMWKNFREMGVNIISGTEFVDKSELSNPKFSYVYRRLRMAYTFLDYKTLMAGVGVLRKAIEAAYNK